MIGQKYNPVSPRPSEPDRFVIGGEYVEPGPANCLGPQCGGSGVIQDREVMMMMMDTSNLPVIGIGRNRRNLRVRRRKRLNRNK